jgi:hypothetical protein
MEAAPRTQAYAIKNTPEGMCMAGLRTLCVRNEEIQNTLYKLLVDREHWMMTDKRDLNCDGPCELAKDGEVTPLYDGAKPWKQLSEEEKDAVWGECVTSHIDSTVILVHGGKGPVVIGMSQDGRYRIVAATMGEEFHGTIFYVPKSLELLRA